MQSYKYAFQFQILVLIILRYENKGCLFFSFFFLFFYEINRL